MEYLIQFLYTNNTVLKIVRSKRRKMMMFGSYLKSIGSFSNFRKTVGWKKSRKNEEKNLQLVAKCKSFYDNLKK
jgi:hypothetical protein